MFAENLCGGMGTAAFVALLMSLCNRSFSATQFALLSALSAVGRVYVGPAAGWLVELWGWPTFYAFSVAAALPGLLLLAAGKNSLQQSQEAQRFALRRRWASGYRWALRLLAGGAALLALWLLALALNASGLVALSLPLYALFNTGCIVMLLGIFTGTLLDYLAQREAA